MHTGVVSYWVVWQVFFERYTRVLLEASPEFPIHFQKTYIHGEALGRSGGGLAYAPTETAPVCVSLTHAGKTTLRAPTIPITPQFSSTPSIRNAQSASLLHERSCCLST